MAATETVEFLLGLQSWRARAGFVSGRIAARLHLPVALQKQLYDEVHGRYMGAGGVFDLRPGTLDAWTVHPAHERETHAELHRLFDKRGGIMLDVGGYCGSFCMRYRSIFERIFVFEPFAGNFAAIARNIELSQAHDVIVPVGAAAAEVEGRGELHLATADTHSLVASGSSSESTLIETVSLDGYLAGQRVDVRSVRLVKIDVEGAEVAVLRGATKLLALAEPLILAEANTSDDEERVCTLLGEFGYKKLRKLDGRNVLFAKTAAPGRSQA